MGDDRTLTLIDGSSYIFRAYHAIPHLSTSKGLPTNAVYGFTLMLLRALREGNPDHVAIAFDLDGKAFRKAIDPNYKAHRPPPPEDLMPQFPLIRRVVEAMNVPVVELSGYEADDVIATLADEALREGFRVIVVTGDKDLMQIVREGVELYDSMQEKHTGFKEVVEKIGVRPDQVVDYLSLLGDAVDNVPGVPGVGPKTASTLLQRFGSLDELLRRIDEVEKPKLRETLKAHLDQLRMARQLVTLKRDLTLPVKPGDLVRKPPLDEELRKLFSELEFSKLLRELPPPPAATTALAVVATRTVLGAEELKALVAELDRAQRVAFQTFSGGLRPRVDALVGMCFQIGDGPVHYLPLGHHYLGVPRQLSTEQALGMLRPWLEDARKTKLGHDLKKDVLALERLGVRLQGLAFDVELGSYLLNPSRREHALADLARERLSLELPADPRLLPGKKKKALSEIPVEEGAAFAGAGTGAIASLAGQVGADLGPAGLDRVMEEIELPLLPLLARMEALGIKVDPSRLKTIGEAIDAQIKVHLADIYRLAGHEFNVSSNPQLAQVLFEELKLPVLRRGKTGPSADQEVLEKLAEQHALPRSVLEFRSLFKLKGTYVDALPSLIEADGRIHTSFHQAATATGRLSSSDPNLQNIPVRSELGKQIREAFVAEPGWMLLSADYSQIELRVLAHVSEDPALLDAFAKGEDVHTRTASEVFGVAPDAVTTEMRRAAKAINFGIAYGQSAFGLAQRLDLPGVEAQAIIDRYFARYAGVRRWLDQTTELARKQGVVHTLFGRRRLIPDIHSRVGAVRQAAERTAVNTPIQGAAADLIKLAMIRADRMLAERKLKARMVLQVHDELLFEVPREELGTLRELAVEAMEGAAALKVRLAVDVGEGATWAEAH